MGRCRISTGVGHPATFSASTQSRAELVVGCCAAASAFEGADSGVVRVVSWGGQGILTIEGAGVRVQARSPCRFGLLLALRRCCDVALWRARARRPTWAAVAALTAGRVPAEDASAGTQRRLEVLVRSVEPLAESLQPRRFRPFPPWLHARMRRPLSGG